MPNGRRQYPFFTINFYPIAAGQGRQRHWAYYAETGVRLVIANGSQRSDLLPMRLDTGAFMSLLPKQWVSGSRPIVRGAAFSVSSETLTFRTAAGEGKGSLLMGEVGTVFETDPSQAAYRFRWLATANLNGRGFGLLALRDIVDHFILRTEGRHEVGPDQIPLVLPDLELVPRRVWDRIRYRCPRCGICTWGRAGLHLICGDDNVALVVS